MYKIYQVTTNETLEDVARKFNTTREELIRLNGNINNLIGSYLIVPNNNEYQTYIVKDGDNIYKIARDNNIDFSTLLKINGLDADDYIYPNQQILLPTNKMYVTNEGDTMGMIFNKLGITPNQISNLEEIKVAVAENIERSRFVFVPDNLEYLI